MNIPWYVTIEEAVRYAAAHLHEEGYVYRSDKWQGMETTDMHSMLSVEHFSFSVDIPETQEDLQFQCAAQQPWSEDHFQERVGGLPLNPGDQYKNWKFYKHNPENDKFRTEGEQFTHTYMERFWPKQAGHYTDLIHKHIPSGHRYLEDPEFENHKGIRYEYGDLSDVLELLRKEPLTRQAFLPIWFPEDTGVKHGGRVPCTLGYHFQIRSINHVMDRELNITYYIRAVDFFRHFRDDIYLAGRLLQWMLSNLKDQNPQFFNEVKMGKLVMHIADLHCFAHEKNMVRRAFQ